MTIRRFAVLLGVVLSVSSCTIHVGGPPPGAPPEPQEPSEGPTEPRGPEDTPGEGLSGIRNNADITLGPGAHASPGTISANSVTIRGAGTGATVINGDLVVRGNNLTMSGVLIEGSVFLYANNADLRGALISGSVANGGNNNSW